jgi:hypothetical protein
MSVRWRGRKVGGVEMVLLDALAPSGRLASFSDSLEIFRRGADAASLTWASVQECPSKQPPYFSGLPRT